VQPLCSRPVAHYTLILYRQARAPHTHHARAPRKPPEVQLPVRSLLSQAVA
jgi:hypothetical protein